MAGHLLSDELLAQVIAAVRHDIQRNIATFHQPVPQRTGGQRIQLAKGTSNISKGSSGTMTLYYRNSSGTPTISSPAQTITVYAELGAYTANKLAYVEMIGNQWVILNTECAS